MPSEGELERWTAWLGAKPAATGLPVGERDRFLLEVWPAGQRGNKVLAFDAGEVRTLVDPAQLDSSGRSWIGRWDPSPDGSRLAVQLTDARERTRLWVLDRETGAMIDGPIDRCWYTNIAWFPDSSGFYYVRTDPILGGYRQHLLRHIVGEAPDQDGEVPVPGAADDPTCPMLAPALVDDGRWLVVAQFAVDAEVFLHIADLRGADSAGRHDVGQPVFRTTRAEMSREGGLPAFAAGRFHLVSTEATHDRGAVFAVAPEHLHRRERWRRLIPEDPDPRTVIRAVGAAHVGDDPVLVVTRARDGVSWLTIHDPQGRLLRTVRPPEGVRVASARTWGLSQGRLLVRWRGPGFSGTTEHHPSDPHGGDRIWRPPSAVGPAAPRVEAETEVFPVRFQPAGTEPEAVIWVSRRRGTSGPVPTLLTGYGILGIPTDPEPEHFAGAFEAWRRAGGAVASAIQPGGGDLGERRGHVRDGADGDLSEEDWLRAREALVAAGVATPDAITALGWSGPCNTLLNLARDHPGAFPVVATAAPMVGFPEHDLSDLAGNPDRVPTDCSGLWKFGRGAAATDAHRRLEALGWQEGTHVIIAVADQDTRVDPATNGLRYSRALAEKGVSHTLIRTAEGGHQLEHAPPELLGGLLAAAAAHTGLPAPEPNTTARFVARVIAGYAGLRAFAVPNTNPVKTDVLAAAPTSFSGALAVDNALTRGRNTRGPTKDWEKTRRRR